MNTNADALSRIKLDSNILKTMIPTTINVLTREMKKQTQRINSGKTTTDPKEESDQLYVWECTSISDVRNVKQIKFYKEEKMRANKWPIITINKKEIIIPFSDNLKTDLGLVLEKLIRKMQKYKIHELAMSYDDEIFKYVDVIKFKKNF